MPSRRAARKIVSPSRISTSRSSMVKVFAVADIALAGHLVGRRRVRDARLAVAISRPPGGALLVVAVAGRLLFVADRS